MELSLLAIFIPTVFLVSISPGMCMTLALTLGISHGYRRTLPMMYGELLGVASVATAAVLGVAALILEFPMVFTVFKWLGGAYLIYVGVTLWRTEAELELAKNAQDVTPRTLFIQGFVTAASNPKGWAFTISLLPPFINDTAPLAPQLVTLVCILLLSEFVCMSLYATGGRTLKRWLSDDAHVVLLNRLSGSLMMGVGLWLALG